MLLSLLTVKVVVPIKLYYSLRVFYVDVLVSAVAVVVTSVFFFLLLLITFSYI
jgi:hypothetical protein